ncbi:MAG: BNR repeat-containing protein, partial [Cyclobacteriaceae bacterium]
MRRFSILSLLILVSLVAYPQTSTYEKTVVSSSVWSENPVIATSTQQNGMAVYENYVYMVYYNTDRNMCIARNSNYGVGEWVTVVLPHVYEQRRLSNGDIVYDNHNTPNIAISPNDKRIHLAFDLHAADLRYIISDENAAIASDANFTASLFSATRNYLQSSERAITLTTYPRFFVGADNKLFIMYRVGGSGSGDTFLGEYKDDGFWFSPGKLISRDGNYNGSTSRCAYFNDVHYADGKIYLTWVWRETPDGTTNHDLMFAYSDDNGQTWRNSAGTSLAIPMSLNSPGINVATIPTGSGLTNHNGCTVDGHGNVHVTHRISGAYKHFVGVRAGGTFNWSSGNTITTFAGDRSKVYADPKTNDLYFMVRHGASLKMFTTASNGELWNQWSQKNEISDKFITSGNSFMNAAGDKLTSMTVSSDDRLQIIRWSLSTNSPTISEKVDLTKFTTDGIYAIYNVGHDKYITPRSTTGGNIAMTAGTADEFKWIIKQNGDKYNIMTVDEQLLLGSNGDQGRLLDNTATRRNDATGGTSSGSGGFLITFEQTSTATLLKNPEYTLKPIWNGNRTSNQYVGMSDKEINSDWHLIRLGDLPGASNTWTGATSKAWDVAGNWSANAVPTATDPVVIADVANKPVIASGNIEVLSLDISDAAMLTVSTGASLSIPGALTATGTGHVVVESGASLLTSGSVTGTSHVFKRTTTFDSNTGKYSVVGSPVSGASTSSLGSLVYSYDETVAFGSDGSARFKEVTTPETMAGGNAYFSAFTGEVTFTGTPHTGDVSVPLAYDANDGENAGFNLVSNPYPAAINYLELIKETNNPNISGTVYLWDDGGSDVGQRSNSDY